VEPVTEPAPTEGELDRSRLEHARHGRGHGAHRPTERLQTGTDPTRGEQVTLAEQITAAEQAGDWAKARTLKSQQLLELGKR
jgi:hypothetical protein